MLRMSEEKRILLGMQMIEDVKTVAESSLRFENPTATLAERKVLLLKRYYGHELLPQDLEACARQLHRYWQGRQGET